MLSTSKNTLYLLIGYTYQKIASLVYFIFLARYLGVENFGKYNFAISFTSLFIIIVDFAFTLVLTREIARDKEKIKSYLGNVLFFKIIAAVFSVFLIFVLSKILNFPSDTTKLIYLSILVVILDSFANSFYGAFRGIMDMRFESLGLILHKTTMVLMGFIFMKMNLSLVFMMLPMVLGSVVYFLNALIFFRQKLGFWPKPVFENKTFKFLFNLMLPFFGATVFSQIFLNIGPVLLSFLGNDKSVGYFSAANKIPMAVVALVGGAFGAALYPSFSYWFIQDKSRLKGLFKDGLFYLILIFMPIVIGGLILSQDLINFIYGKEYLPAALTFSVLFLALPLQLIDYLIIGLLNATEKQKTNFKIRIAATICFIIFNIILIPKFLDLGVSISFLISALLIFVLEWIWLRQFLSLKLNSFLKKIFLVLLASLLMGGGVYFLKERFHFLIVVLCGIIIYGSLIFLFRLVKKDDIYNLFLGKRGGQWEKEGDSPQKRTFQNPHK